MSLFSLESTNEVYKNQKQSNTIIMEKPQNLYGRYNCTYLVEPVYFAVIEKSVYMNC
jgi:hypothetical protein